MLLAVDAGNTNVVFAVHDGNEWRRPLAHRHAHRPHLRRIRRLAAGAVPAFRHQAQRHRPLRHRHRGAGRAVQPAPAVPRLVRRRAADRPRARSTGASRSASTSPNEVGADRLLNALASHTHYGGPLVVVDFGTATTFDVVDSDGAYLGGVIAPGINLSIEALHRAAARLPRIGIGRPQAVIGRSTVPRCSRASTGAMSA